MLRFQFLSGSLVIAVGLLLGAACGGDGDKQPATGTPATPPTTTEMPTPDETLPAVAAARQDLALRFDRAPEEMEIVSVTPQQWPDSCLGLAEEGEVCAEVITPGYEVVLSLESNEYTFRTDETGAAVRFDSLDFLDD